ncbi:MAG: Cof-type HAD-IIB family hydrolase [Enterococcus sp.]
MIKAIFFDIDGTLVTNTSKLQASTKRAIEMAQANGILCGIATGRSPVRIHELVEELSLDMYVVYNGQLVFTAEETIVDHPFQPEVLQEIVTFADEKHRQIMFGGRDRLDGSMTMKLSEAIWLKRIVNLLPKKFPVRLLRETLQKFSPHRRKERYEGLEILNEPIYQCILLSAVSEQEKLAKLFPNCTFQRSNPYSVDIIPKGGSKLHGIEAFLEAKGIKNYEVMAFGDNYNDIEMLSGVGIGIAMGNAQKATKEAAVYVTDTNEKDGIYKALQHYKIIE